MAKTREMTPKEIATRAKLIERALEQGYTQEQIKRWADNPDTRDLFNTMAVLVAEDTNG